MTLTRRIGSQARLEILPVGLVGAVVAWNLWSLLFVLHVKVFDSDAVMHELMVHTMDQLLRAHRFPLTSWFPYFGLGSPYFMHYQSLGAFLAAIPGLWMGSLSAFDWTTYLLIALWPFAIYVAARLMGLGRKGAAFAAIAAPFISSNSGVGLEASAWLSLGLWAQLWGAWMLPFAWAFTFRAVSSRRFILPASLFIALTVAAHFEMGYLALGFPMLLAVILFKKDGRAAVNMGLVLVLALGMAAWAVAPLVMQATWSATDVVLGQTVRARGYGASRNLQWLISGQLFDGARAAVITPLVFVGALNSGVNWRRNTVGRASLSVFVASLLLSFGPTTWGVIADIVPGHGDIYFRRFLVGVHLAGLLLAGIGASWLVDLCLSGFRKVLIAARWRPFARSVAAVVSAGVALLAFLYWASPAWRQVSTLYSQSALTAGGWAAVSSDARDLARVSSYVSSAGGGRAYVEPTLLLGPMAAFEYMQGLQLDQVGAVQYARSLMTYVAPQFNSGRFQEYPLFGVRYLVLSSKQNPPKAVPAARVMEAGPYAVWRVAGTGYVDLFSPAGTVAENRTTVAVKAKALFQSQLLARHEDLLVAWDGGKSPNIGAAPTMSSAPGVVVSLDARLADGVVKAVVDANRISYVLLSASYDPGWRVTVDHRAEQVVMLAPALLGVKVGVGRHLVVFRYIGFRWYPLLFLFALGSLVLACYVSRSDSVSRLASGLRGRRSA